MVDKKNFEHSQIGRVMMQSMTPSVLSNLLELKMGLFQYTSRLSEFLATVSGIILTIALGAMTTDTFASFDPVIKVGILTVVGSSLLTICMCLLITEPNIERDRDSNSFDYGSRFSDLTRAEYIETIRRTVKDTDRIIDTYGHELHKLDHDILRRFKAVKAISFMFLAGLSIGGITIVIASLV